MVAEKAVASDAMVCLDAELVDRLPMSAEPTMEELADLWIDQRRQADIEHFKLGIIAAKVESIYGEHSIQEFAKKVREKPSVVYSHLRVYRYCSEHFIQMKNLTWTHFLHAIESGLPETERQALLIEASDNDWSTPQFKRELLLRRSAKLLETAPHADPEIALVLAEWKELKPKIERFARHQQFALLSTDFINGVDDELDRPWDSAKEFLERQVELGSRDAESLLKATGFQPATIDTMCDELVETGDYYYSYKGGESDIARGGARVRLIAPKDVPSGDSYEPRRPGGYE